MGLPTLQGGTPTAGAGGAATVAGAAGVGTNKGGGNLTLNGGAATGSGTAGTASLTGGKGGSSAGGTVTISGGGSTSGAAGAATVQGGTPTAGNGGAVNMTGSAGVGSNKNGGNVVITAGAATGTGTAGIITLTTTGAEAMRVTTSGSVGIGTTAPAAKLHVNGGVIIADDAASCSATNAGELKYVSAQLYVCTGAAWVAVVQVQGTPPPTAPAGSGYFVLSYGTYNGNLGGLTGADALCLTELTTNTGWQGYATANSNGQLIASKVHAFLGVGTPGNNLMPLTTYYFANAGNAAAGGASFTTDSYGNGPNDSADWAAANYFSGSYSYWTNRASYASTAWSPGGDRYSTGCNNWTDSSSGGDTGESGMSAFTDGNRWAVASVSPARNTTQPIICFVNP